MEAKWGRQISDSKKPPSKLISQQNILKDQILQDSKRFDQLEARFDQLAQYNQETVALKDEYKLKVEKLILENTNLKNELNAKESQKIIDFYNEIEELNKKLAEELNISTNLRNEKISLVAENETLIKNFKNLKTEFEILQEKFEKLETTSSLEISSLTQELANLKSTYQHEISTKDSEIKNLIKTNFDRAETIEKLNSKVNAGVATIEKLTNEIKFLKNKWEEDLDKVDANCRIRALLEEIKGYKSLIDGMKLSKNKLKNELSNEKLLNQRLRNYH